MEDGWDSFSDPQLGGPPPHRKQINNRKSKQGNKHRAPRPQDTGWADEQSFLRTFHPHGTRNGAVCTLVSLSLAVCTRMGRCR